jgi:hypothetical protein
VALVEVRPCPSDTLFTTGCDDGVALDDGSSSRAKRVPLH